MIGEAHRGANEKGPLTGQVVPALAVRNIGGLPVVRWHQLFLEYDLHQVVESEVSQDDPRMGLVRSFHVPEGVDSRTVTLEAVKAEEHPPMLFLFSKLISDGSVIITSRMGHGDGLVVVRPPKYGSMDEPSNTPARHVEMFDAPQELSEEELVRLHQERIHPLRGELEFLAPAEVDELFLYMSED